MDEACEGPERLTYGDDARVNMYKEKDAGKGRSRNVVDVRRAHERAGLLDLWWPRDRVGRTKGRLKDR